MQDPNLPPGVSVSMIPGNRPEDIAFDDAFEKLDEAIHRICDEFEIDDPGELAGYWLDAHHRGTMWRMLYLVRDERLAQERKWGEQNHEDFKWNAILSEEVGEAARMSLEHDFLRAAWTPIIDSLTDEQKQTLRVMKRKQRDELVQVAAVAIAWLECLARKEKT